MDVLVKPMEYAEAVAKVRSRLPLGSTLDTEGWADVPLALRERVFFSARVESARVASELHRRVLTSGTKAEFVAKSREWLRGQGFDRATSQQDLRQLTSTRRLELIYEHNTESARGYGWWKQGQDPDVLDAFPAQEFVRVAARQDERADWPQRWAAAGGRDFGGRMIALKNDPVWRRLSRFGTPWPPFDFGSGMGVEDVDRDEAEALGLLEPDAPVEGDEADFNREVEASAEGLRPEILRGILDLFGDDVRLREGRLQWSGDRLGELWRAATGPGPKSFGPDDRHLLGAASVEAVAVARRDLGVDLAGWRLEVRADELRHIARKHGSPGDLPGSGGERFPDQRAITASEVRALPLAWRTPTRMEWAERGRPQMADTPADWPHPSFRTILDLGDRLYVGEYSADAAGQLLRVATMWVKTQEGGQP